MSKYIDIDGLRHYNEKVIEKINASIPTNISHFNNDSGYITTYTETDPTVPLHVKSITADNITNWNKVSDKASKSELSDMQSTIENKIPTKNSQLTNDSLYITNQVNDLSNYYLKTEIYTQNEVDTKIANLIDSAPETLNTLNELAVAIQENDTLIDTLNSAIGTKANQTDLNNYSLTTHNHDTNYSKLSHTHTYSEITDTPTIPDTSSFITKDVDNLTNYYDKTNIDNQIKDLENSKSGEKLKSSLVIPENTSEGDDWTVSAVEAEYNSEKYSLGLKVGETYKVTYEFNGNTYSIDLIARDGATAQSFEVENSVILGYWVDQPDAGALYDENGVKMGSLSIYDKAYMSGLLKFTADENRCQIYIWGGEGEWLNKTPVITILSIKTPEESPSSLFTSFSSDSGHVYCGYSRLPDNVAYLYSMLLDKDNLTSFEQILENGSSIKSGSILGVTPDSMAYMIEGESDAYTSFIVDKDGILFNENIVIHSGNASEILVDTFANKTHAHSYNDLTDKPIIPNVSSFITKDVNNLTNYTTTTQMNSILNNYTTTEELNTALSNISVGIPITRID